MKLPEGWHEQTEWEAAVAYEQGFRDGYAAADAALVAALGAALGGAGAADYREAVRRHLRQLDARARRAAADRGDLAA